ncbi:hypothetical protein HID58_095079 [Brassica napus]|uniref:Uncharacterized protein n=1 Tax=Brassica napus TaxID=3708 RepID=A0ABQ7X547_BRANA|nr:hypothetical protein HID58_095079 [Brassica napus]
MNDEETNLARSFSDDTHSGFGLPDLYLSDEWMDDDLVSAVSGMNHSYGYQTNVDAVFFSGSSSSFIQPTSPSTKASVAPASAETTTNVQLMPVQSRKGLKEIKMIQALL